MELDGWGDLEIGFAGENVEAGQQQFGGDVQGRRFSQIVNIRLEGQAQAANAGRYDRADLPRLLARV